MRFVLALAMGTRQGDDWSQVDAVQRANGHRDDSAPAPAAHLAARLCESATVRCRFPQGEAVSGELQEAQARVPAAVSARLREPCAHVPAAAGRWTGRDRREVTRRPADVRGPGGAAGPAVPAQGGAGASVSTRAPSGQRAGGCSPNPTVGRSTTARPHGVEGAPRGRRGAGGSATRRTAHRGDRAPCPGCSRAGRHGSHGLIQLVDGQEVSARHCVAARRHRAADRRLPLESD